MQKQLAKYYMQLGLLNSSLDIFLNLQMWEDVINCYQALDKRDKAEEVIRQQLAIKETPDLYCSLGEATRDIQYFEKAIELSKGKSARAYRMLAKYQFSKEQYQDAIVNFEKSLAINSMQYNAWFMLGSAAFRIEKWETAVKAFRTCTHLDPCFENWNNLAASHIKLNQK
jgi:tetratricopeptide (TPR) repeat protein